MYNLSEAINFLTLLAQNNNREWFTAHKSDYELAHAEMILFADALLGEIKKTDHIETTSGKKSLYRIYRDIRFSKDKTPYKNNLGGSFRRATAQLRGGYYFHIQPGNSFAAGGFWGPNKEDLLHIRKQLAADPDPLYKIIHSSPFRSTFGKLLGEQLKTAPKGFEKDDPAIDLLRYKQYIVQHSFTDKDVLSKNFHVKIVAVFQQMRPFFDYMSEILTTDLNGVPFNE